MPLGINETQLDGLPRVFGGGVTNTVLGRNVGKPLTAPR